MLFSNTGFSNTFNVLNKGLNASSLRHQVISNNIANLNTPNYKRKEVTFEGELHRALYGPKPIPAQRTDPRHYKFKGEITLNEVTPKVIAEPSLSSRNDKSNVDLNEEMAALAKNNINYNAFVTSLTDMIHRFKNVIQKGGRS